VLGYGGETTNRGDQQRGVGSEAKLLSPTTVPAVVVWWSESEEAAAAD
jgi:hypothetical protein